jgi:hypothetical protein
MITDTVGDQSCVFLAGLRRAERMVATRLEELSRGGRP